MWTDWSYKNLQRAIQSLWKSFFFFNEVKTWKLALNTYKGPGLYFTYWFTNIISSLTEIEFLSYHSFGFQIFVVLIESATVTKNRSAKHHSRAQDSVCTATSFFAQPHAGPFAGSKCWRALESSPATSPLFYLHSLFRWSDPDTTWSIYTLISAIFTFALRAYPANGLCGSFASIGKINPSELELMMIPQYGLLLPGLPRLNEGHHRPGVRHAYRWIIIVSSSLPVTLCIQSKTDATGRQNLSGSGPPLATSRVTQP